MHAFVNCDIYTGDDVLHDRAILVDRGVVVSLVRASEIAPDIKQCDLKGESVSPGFIDIQVNGGGGVLFNDSPSPESIRLIGAAHRLFGTTHFLPTFITGSGPGMRQAAAAVDACLEEKMPGVLGIHFEGPFISSSKAGVHDPAFIRPPDDVSIDAVCSLKRGVTVMTFAPENVERALLHRLTEKGILLAIGHSNASFDEVSEAFASGSLCVTHLFNAMSPLTSREPGVTGAALAHEDSWAGIIVDGHHVHYSVVRIAWRTKRRGRLFLVTDAMPPVGGTVDEFRLGRYEIAAKNGRCVTADGVLAGSALDMATAVRNCVQHVGIPKDEALRMASTYPAEFLGLGGSLGRIAPGYKADFAVFNNQIRVSGVIVQGNYLPTTPQQAQ